MLPPNPNENNNEIKVKTIHNAEIMIFYIEEHVSYEELCREIRGIYRFPPDQVLKRFLYCKRGVILMQLQSID